MSKHSVEDSLIFTIIDLANQVYKSGGVLTNKVGLTTQQWLILLYLAGDPHFQTHKKRHKPNEEGAYASEIADVLNVSRPNITNMINILMQKGLILQAEDSMDRRRKKLKLTDKARKILKKLQPFRERGNKKLFAHLQPAEKEQLLLTLKSCLDVMGTRSSNDSAVIS
jgi:DNA-binding MarR family transcriptional regulator